jgi:hypothetical protein
MKWVLVGICLFLFMVASALAPSRHNRKSLIDRLAERQYDVGGSGKLYNWGRFRLSECIVALGMLIGFVASCWKAVAVGIFRAVTGKPPVEKYREIPDELLPPKMPEIPEARKELNSPGKMDELKSKRME